jgi:trans-aconitate methyltransferase
MDKAEFDKFADEYRALHAVNVRASGEAPEYFAEYKVRDVAALLSEAQMPVQRILDFGAGVGTSVPYFRRYFPSASLTCLDVSERSLGIGASRFPGEADFRSFDGQTIPLSDHSFDLAFAACVFHHIEHSEHHRLLSELRRVLCPGGCMAVFEHNPRNPLTVHAVNTCPFDEKAVLIPAPAMRQSVAGAGFTRATIRYRIFFPHFLGNLRPLESWLTWCPLGAQYSVLGFK